MMSVATKNVYFVILNKRYSTSLSTQGKLRGEGPPKRMRIVWTDGWVEPGDKWMMETTLG